MSVLPRRADVLVGDPVRSARIGGGDDLQRVRGIGPREEQALRGAGITTWIRLAAAGPAQLRAALASAGVAPVAGMEDWSAQAGSLLAGDDTGPATPLAARASTEPAAAPVPDHAAIGGGAS